MARRLQNAVKNGSKTNDRRQLAFFIGHISLDVDRLPDRDSPADNRAGAQRYGGRLVGIIHRIIDWLIARMFKDVKDWDQ